MKNALADLDELVISCRNDTAREYISEAIDCYRIGAFRAAIVATWVAVCYDIISKLHELALAGDKAAEVIVNDVEKARSTGDLNSALTFERGILTIARDQFELVSPLEFVDLERLQHDRNRCAHPSLVSDTQAFSPPGELARLHIRSAITHLLQHPPAQGKQALAWLLREVASEYFPTDVSKAKAAFASGPLSRPRESLVRNFVLVLLKRVLQEEAKPKASRRIYAAICAARGLHSAICDSLLSDKLPTLVRSIEDKDLGRVITLFKEIPESWEHLPLDVRTRCEAFVRALPHEEFGEVEFLLEYKPLQAQAAQRVSRATREDLADAFFFIAPPQVLDRVIQMYLASGSWDAANSLAKVVSTYASHFSEAQQRSLIREAVKNTEITGSFGLSDVVNSLRQTKKIAKPEFEQLLRDNNLEKLALVDLDSV